MRAVLHALAITLFCLLAGWAQAQETRGPNYNIWGNIAERAEAAISDEETPDRRLEELRSELAAFREQFLNAQQTNADRISTLQSQLDALGAPPENGEEAAEITNRRQELNDQLATLRAPVLAAEEAYTRANGLIGEIDNTIRTRQADELFDLGPSPVNPVHWPGAISDITASAGALWTEFADNWTDPDRRAEFRDTLPVVIGLTLLSLLLLARGRGWVERAVNALRKRTRPGTGVWSFLVSILEILVPLLGVYLLVSALSATGLVGERGELILSRLPVWVGILLYIRWLAEQVFRRGDEMKRPVLLDIPRRTEARFYANLLSIMLVLRGVRKTISELDDHVRETVAVLDFPILVICAIALFRLGQILRSAQLAENEASANAGLDGPKFRLALARYLGLLAMAAGVLGPVLAGIGYNRAGEFLVYPAVSTMAIFALLVVLQRFANDLYELFTGRDAATGDSLVPVLSGFVLSLAALPLLALTWGARVADLTELWARFREGFVIGETRISPTDFLTFAVVFAIGYALTRLLQGGLRTSVLPKTKIDVGGQNAIVAGLGYIGVFLAALIAITSAGLDLSSLALVAGALSLGVGFGLQTIVQNFVSGIILLVERPISEGDWIEVGPHMGTVKDISVRSTRIETFDKTDVIVPNADLISGTVTNYTRGNTLGRVIVSVGVAYGTDTRKVEQILTSVARVHPKVMMNPEPFIYFKGFGADALEFEIRAILSDVLEILVVQNEMHHEIARRFAEEGIEIPFAQRDVWLRNPEALRAGDDPAASRPVVAETTDDTPPAEGDARTAGMSDSPPDAPDADR